MVSKGRRITRKNLKLCSVDHMLPTISPLYKLIFILCSSLLYICCCSATDHDTITINSWIHDERRETLVSANGTFELGFFTPNESPSKARYVGLWYYNFSPQTVVWVANRDNPISDRNGSFGITEYGNLEVVDGNGTFQWSTRLESSASRKTAKLLDSGNLVLIDEKSTKYPWESFNNPTDTFLPGMMMTEDLRLTSWNSSNDPATGSITFLQDKNEVNQYTVQNGSTQYWKSGVSGKFITSDEMPSAISNFLSGFTLQKRTFKFRNESNILNASYVDTRLVMNSSGQVQYYLMNDTKGRRHWELIWAEPGDSCGVLNACGDYGICNSKYSLQCKCMPGFQPLAPEKWESGDFTGGCKRNTLPCEKKIDNFLSLKKMKVGKPESVDAKDENGCKEGCVNDCNCQAYSFEEAKIVPRSGTTVAAQCWIWNADLKNLREEYTYGRDINVRIAVSDIASIKRSCMPCGTNIIPYPLSTESNCGDPMYSYFHCDNSTGKLSFGAPGGTYNVTSINPTTKKFVIQAPNVEDYCDAKNQRGKFLQLNQTTPFYVNSNCTVRSVKMNGKGGDELEISWNPPLLPPTCNSSKECEDWPNSTCNGTGREIKRCLCNANFQWNSSNISCTQIVSEGNPESPSVKRFEPPSSHSLSRSLIIAIAISSVVVLIALSCAIVYMSYLWKRRLARRQENRENIQRNQALYGSERRVKDLIDSGEFREEDKKGIDVPFFDLESILAATDNFSDANKLGRGGFGSVYKGTLPGGREIAVKRLSNVSVQGLGEFKNEVVLIAKLQHRNLVRLLGYCIKGEEKILLYEFMPNKSLDSFIFDRTLCMVLNWELRFNIILGIARGLLYLHQDSRLRIIHRDLKTSNILLDEEMNPKISDFGLARIFEGKQIEGSTNRVVGTYGYMSPEYALDGLFSIKSDVFSFGVVVLEIISGRRNTGFYQSKITLSLLGYAWKLWNEDKTLDLMHETLRENCNTNEFLRCLNVGLLCVQEDANDRPTMSNVVFMLGSETTTLPTPKQPAFIVRRDPSSTASSSTKPETSSNTGIVEGR